ncbi:MAG: 5'/3'-nucleotidase SurE [Candidatus Sericytochromatia bacterium]|nr:5'/3'-nucleotidase SurE [Candidatus Sericytochromatia bacterium]
MRILVSNDDGIMAPGIRALAETLAVAHDVYVVAPDRERSATGHALTLHKPLRVETVDFYKGVKAAWALNGTPSDCIKLATGALLDAPPDIVVSGINRGPNLGIDVIYSGTVSAAVEGMLMGYPSIAVSLAAFDDLHYATAADAIALMVGDVAAYPFPPRTLLNVNVPSLPSAEIAGTVLTKLGVRKYHDRFETRVDLRGRTYYWLAGEIVDVVEDPAADVMAIRNHQISITPVHYDLTCYPLLRDMEAWGQSLAAKLGHPRTKES